MFLILSVPDECYSCALNLNRIECRLKQQKQTKKTKNKNKKQSETQKKPLKPEVPTTIITTCRNTDRFLK